MLYQVTFFSHLTVPFSHCAVSTSHVTVIFTHLVVSLLFSHILLFHPHIVQFQHHMWQFFSHIERFSYFSFLIFDSFILTLCSSNITHDSSLVTLGGSLTFFSHLTVPSSNCEFQHHMWQLFSHILWLPYFFLTFDGSILTLCSSNIICDSSLVILGGSLTFF